MLTYKCLNQLAPPYLSELIKVYNPGRALRSGDQLKLHVPTTQNVTMGDHAFSHAAPVLWNELPIDVKSAA